MIRASTVRSGMHCRRPGLAQTITVSEPARFGTCYTIIWGLAELGKSLVYGTFGALLPIFYQDYLGLEARWIGIASIIYAIWNAINDPLFGYITDSTRSRRGRRIPYLRFTAPFSWADVHPCVACAAGGGADRAVRLDAGRNAPVRHVLYDHRSGLLRARCPK